MEGLYDGGYQWKTDILRLGTTSTTESTVKYFSLNGEKIKNIQRNSWTLCANNDVNANLEPLGVAERRQGS